MIIKQINNNKYTLLKDSKLISLYTCLEELQLWKGENPFDVEAGVDYFSIFDNKAFIEVELSKVLDKHKNAFESYIIENIKYENNILSVSIIFNVNTEIAYRFNLHINKM